MALSENDCTEVLMAVRKACVINGSISTEYTETDLKYLLKKNIAEEDLESIVRISAIRRYTIMRSSSDTDQDANQSTTKSL